MPTADEFLDGPDAGQMSADAFLDDAPIKQPVSTKMDMLKSAAGGLERGVAAVPMMLPNLLNQAAAGPQMLYRGIRDTFQGNPTDNSPLFQPFYSSEDVLQGQTPLGMPEALRPHTPETAAGVGVDLISQMIGSILGTKGLTSAKLPQDLLASETSGSQLPKGSPAIPPSAPPELQNLSPRAWIKAKDILREALKDDGMTADEIATYLDDANLNNPNLPITALDVAQKDVGGIAVRGKNLLGLADVSANRPGQGASMAGEMVARGQAAKDRIGKLFDDTISKEGLYDVSDDALEKMATQAPPAYEKAFSKAPVYNERVAELLQTPEIQSGIKKGLKIQRIESAADGKPFDPTDYAITAFDEAGDPIISAVPNMRLLDAGKKGLDAMINENKNPLTGKKNEMGRALTKLKSSYVKTLDDINPDYAVARKTYGDQASRLQALEDGRKFMSMDKEEISRFMKTATDAEKSAFSAGVRRDLQDKMARVGDDANAIKRLWKEEIRDRLEPIFPTEASFKKFANIMEQEHTMVRVNNALTRQSATAPRLKYNELMEDKPLSVSRAINAVRSPVSASADLLHGKLAKSAKGMSAETAAALMHYLTAKNPQIWREFAAEVAPPGAMARNLPKLALGGIGAVGGLAALMSDAKADDLSVTQQRQKDDFINGIIERGSRLEKGRDIEPDSAPVISTGDEWKSGPNQGPSIKNPLMVGAPEAAVPPSFRAAEGYRDKVYKDTTGNKTVGIGFNMQSGIARDVWKKAAVKEDFDKVFAGKQKISEETAHKLLAQSYKIAKEDVAKLIPNAQKLTKNQQEALAQLSFQHGRSNLKESLPGVIGAANSGNAKLAAIRLLHSDYAKKYKDRATKLARMLYHDTGYGE